MLLAYEIELSFGSRRLGMSNAHAGRIEGGVAVRPATAHKILEWGTVNLRNSQHLVGSD